MKRLIPPQTYTDTKWGTGKEKDAFIEKLARFVVDGFRYEDFTKAMYQRLSNLFGHIAHYDRDGFYSTWFASRQKQLEWLEYIRDCAIYGDPAWTWSDAERVFQGWLQTNDHIREGLSRQIAESRRVEAIETASGLLAGMSAADRQAVLSRLS